MRIAMPIELNPKQAAELKALSKGRRVSVRLAERAMIVLLAAEGKDNQQIGEELGITRQKAGRWRLRFAQHVMAGIEKDAPRPGRFPKYGKRIVNEVIEKTLHETPVNATHWSRRSMAEAIGLSDSTIGRIWRQHGLKPHLIRNFKLSNDRRFVEKLEDVVGLYLSPPEHAVVFSCDEKSQIQALDRTQLGLPLRVGRCSTLTHDYKRNGTTSLFAALNIANGEVIGTCMKKHRHQEWIRFLNCIKKQVPKDKEVHIICDNYSTHKHEKVKAWEKRNSRFHMHFTPTSASWLNMVERFFRDLSENRLKRGVFTSTADLIKAIESYIQNHNQQPKPFIWTATASDILEKVKRGRTNLNKLQTV
jgi:transposase/DNA-binding CsgD family transcriptional regulator